MAHCHNCGEELQRGMKFCPHCGQDQAVVVPQDERIPTENVEGVPPPPQSQPLFGTQQVDSQQGSGMSRTWRIGLLGCGGLGLLLLAVIVVAIVSGSSDETAQGGGGEEEKSEEKKSNSDRKKGGADKAGQQQIAVEETAELADHTFSVAEVERNYQPRNEFSRAEPGNEFMRVWVSIANTSNRPVSFNPFNYKVQDSNGIQQGPGIVSEVPYQFESGLLAPDGNVEGNLVFEVPQNDNDLKLIYESNMFREETVTVEPLQ